MEKCLECGKKELVRDTRESSFEYEGNVFSYDQPGLWCNDCNFVFLEKSDKASTDLLLYDFMAKVDGRLTTLDIRRIRKKLNLTQKAAGELIGGGPNSFSRYETGKSYPSRGTENFLRVLDKHPYLIDEIDTAEAA